MDQDKSALVVLAPEAEPLVAEFRDRFDISAQAGLGAHVTVLFPFRPSDRVSRRGRSEAGSRDSRYKANALAAAFYERLGARYVADLVWMTLDI
jgi:hypothetical protein